MQTDTFETNGRRKPAAGNPIDLCEEACFGRVTTSAEEAVSPPPPLDSLEKHFHKNKLSDFEDDDTNVDNTIIALVPSMLRYDSQIHASVLSYRLAEIHPVQGVSSCSVGQRDLLRY